MAPPDGFSIETFIRVFFNMYSFNNLLLSLIWFHNSRIKWGLLPLALAFLFLCEATKKNVLGMWVFWFYRTAKLIVYLQSAISSYWVSLRNNFLYATKRLLALSYALSFFSLKLLRVVNEIIHSLPLYENVIEKTLKTSKINPHTFFTTKIYERVLNDLEAIYWYIQVEEP